MLPYAELFSPTSMGSLRLKNRLVMAPMALNYSTERGKIVQRQIDYYVERARGGVALIISESNYVSPEGRAGLHRLGLYSDEMVPEHRRLVDAVHAENVPILAQVIHTGSIVSPSAIGQYPVSASTVPLLVKGEPFVGTVPRTLKTAEIEDLVDLWGKAAERAVRAGFDGVLVHAAHGYLLGQFLSPHTNKRTDMYGGSDENRARFLLECVRRIRESIGPGMPLAVRLTGIERHDGGYGADYTCRLARWLEEAGVDLVSISAGNYQEIEWLCAPRSVPEGHNIEVASQVKAAVGIPVGVSGRIKTAEMANRVIAEGMADQVWVGRLLIADPYLPIKMQEGRPQDIRECISCNVCITRLLDGKEVQCTVNPEVGREVEMRLQPAERARKVLVVGGGPAGMEAARVAAVRGHGVILAEKEPNLGGQVRLGGAAPHCVDMQRLVAYQERQVVKAGVSVRLDTEIDGRAIDEIDPDVVVIATGSVPVVPQIPGHALPFVFTAHDVLGGDADDRLGQRVVIVGGGLTGVYTAQYLLERGREVTIVEMMDWIMADGNCIEKKTYSRELGEAGVRVLIQTRAEAITSRGVIVTRLGQRECIPTDSVVLAVGVRANRSILGTLDTGRLDVRVIGDAASARRIQQAMEEGAAVGRAI